MKNLVYYHSNCNDGRGAALAAWLKFGDNAIYKPIGYHDAFPDISEFKNKNVYILDFSFESEGMKTILEHAESVVLLDHHKTAEKNLKDLDCSDKCNIVFDMSKSGCILAYEYFMPNEPIPALFRYLQDYDLWEHNYEESKYLIQALYSEKFTFKRWNELLENKRELDSLIDNGKLIYVHELYMSKGFMKKAWNIQVIDNDPKHNITVVNAPLRLASKLGEVHKTNGESNPMLVYQEFENNCGISLRNGRNALDLSVIAETIGGYNNCRGGGHPGASGISPKCHFHEMIWKI